MIVKDDMLQPREGLLGELDKFIGPGATRAELILQFGVAFVAPILLIIYAIQSHLGWTPLQGIIACVIVLDITGGIVTNATSAAKRWYHRPEQGFRQHFTFILIHFIQPLLIVIFFRSGDWAFLAVIYGYLLLASLIILKSPLYLKRPIAMTLLIGGFTIDQYVLVSTPGLEWFIPMFYAKLLISHLLPETPFKPDQV